MEQPESSLPYSQAPATFPYPEPTPSNPHNPFSNVHPSPNLFTVTLQTMSLLYISHIMKA